MPGSASPVSPLRVLVIEDDPLFQKIIQTYLLQSTNRTKVQLADRLEKGLRELEEGAFDAVLLDLTLPDSEGPETLERFQKEAPEVPVIVLTGLDDDLVAAEAVRQGAQDFLVKSDLSGTILSRAVRYAIERAKSERALRESEGRFRAVLEDQTELVCRYRVEGELVFANPAFCRAFGRPERELLGRSFFDLTGVDEDELAGIRPERPTHAREQQLVLRDGRQAWIEWTDRALFDDRGERTGFQSVGRDTSEQKDLEQQLYHSQKLETLGRLAGGVAHDFNNLLTVIIACCEVLSFEREHEGKEPHPQIFEIEQAAERAASLTRQLLAVSRRHVAQPTVIDLNRVIRQTEEMVRRLIGEPVEVVVRLAHDLPKIKADRAQIEQILVNLVVNARDAMPDGGRLTIETVPTRDESGNGFGDRGERFAELRVTDTGIGMDERTRQKIFEPFFSTKDASQGSGLGLSIVDSLVKQARGRIELESAPHEGTCFRIRFPAIDDDVTSSETRSSRRAPRRASETVLLVEDETAVRNAVSSLLGSQGYVVRTAADAREAWRQLELSGTIDVLLTDVVLPDQNGFELAEEIRTHYPLMPIVFMSGYTDTATDEHCLSESTLFVQKPFSSEQLLRKLEEALAAQVSGTAALEGE